MGASTWEPLLAILPAAISIDYGGVSGPGGYSEMARRAVAAVDDQPWIAVLHSGAGGFAPALAGSAERLTGFIFLDAVLPYPGMSWLETVPAELAARLEALTSAGLAPPWNTWCDEDPTLRLLPDPSLRARFINDLPRVPFAFLSARSPLGVEWESLPSAYVQLSPGYADEALAAAERGWPVVEGRLHHLAMATHPNSVAELLRIAARAIRR